MDVKKIMDKFEAEFLKNEDSPLPKELFLEGTGNSLVHGRKFKTLSLKDMSLVKAGDFDRMSKADQEIAIKIAEWWFDRFYATIKKPIVIPVQKDKVEKTIEVEHVQRNIKMNLEPAKGKNAPARTPTPEDVNEFYYSLKNMPVKKVNLGDKK